MRGGAVPFHHQDYGWSNGQEGPGGIWIIDLDGVSYDLGIRDLRKLITSTMDDFGVWETSWMKGMIEAYHAACPIEPELFEVLLIDMSLPNEFYKNVKAKVSKQYTGIQCCDKMGAEVGMECTHVCMPGSRLRNRPSPGFR